jgi:hypothetical protein
MNANAANWRINAKKYSRHLYIGVIRVEKMTLYGELL